MHWQEPVRCLCGCFHRSNGAVSDTGQGAEQFIWRVKTGRAAKACAPSGSRNPKP